MPHTVLLLCDEPLWARAAREILEAKDFFVIVPLLNKSHPLDILRAYHWEICLLSLGQRQWDGIEILKIAKVDFPTRHIIYFYPDSNRIEGAVAVEMGADKIAPKSISEGDFLGTVLSYYVPGHGHLIEGSVDPLNSCPISRSHGGITLSAREKQILAMIAQGMTYREIANLKNLSLSTVNTYRRRLIVKTGARNGRELLLYAMKSLSS